MLQCLTILEEQMENPAMREVVHKLTMSISGGSPRASICLAQAARARAFMKRRGYVIPEDVRDVAHDVLRHRIGLTYAADAAEVTTEDVITEILNKVQVP